jgi:mannonate dehydratase
MHRRDLLKFTGVAAGAMTVLAQREAKAQAKVEQAARGTPSPIIKDIQVIATQPGGSRLTVVKVLTNQDGLYGYGCGTFAMRAEVVNVAIDKYLKPLLVGRPADRIEDTWQMMVNSGQWRFGPVLNNAMSGVDEALWDIKGRQAGVPVYELLGGKCREAADVYISVSNVDAAHAVDGARKLQAQGVRNFKIFQPGDPGGQPKGLWTGVEIYDPGPSMRSGLSMLEELRKQLGDGVGLLYDMHRKATPNEAIQFAKDVEHLKLFYLEDPFGNQDFAWHRMLRQQCSTPIAPGELFTNPNEYVPLISERLIDYMRMHVSAAGGVTPCRKAAAMGELLGVRTSWHGSGDISPIGHMANVHLDLACYNFGIQEWSPYNQTVQEVFKGCAQVKDGYVYANDAPGWGIEVDEKLAAKYPYGTSQGNREGEKNLNGGWGDYRWPDGTIYFP